MEAQGKRAGLLAWMSFLPTAAPRREKSLSKALRNVRERLILLEGEPGAGKSVALRHVARELANSAARQRDPDALVPLYINLKELDVGGEAVTHESIHDFVLHYINRTNRHDVEEFLEGEFRAGLERGSWLFLFDSFDEIPAVLSAVEPDRTVECFSEAIADFFCRHESVQGGSGHAILPGSQDAFMAALPGVAAVGRASASTGATY